MRPFTKEDFKGIVAILALYSLVMAFIFIFIDPMVSLAASAFYFAVNQKD